MADSSAKVVTTIVIRKTTKRLRFNKAASSLPNSAISKKERDRAFEDFFDTRFKSFRFKKNLSREKGMDLGR